MSGKPDLAACVHVVVGDSAGGTLRLAFPEYRIERVVDDFSVGPLHPLAEEQADLRREYWKEMERELGVAEGPASLLFDGGAAMVERVRAELRAGRPLVLWIGVWAFERLASAWLIEQLLGDAPEAVAYVVESETCLSLLPPDALSSLAENPRLLTGEARRASLAEWAAIHDSPIPAYRWHMEPPGLLFQMPDKPWRTVLGAELHGDDGAVLDARIQEQVSSEWRRAALVVGHVLADCPIGDQIVHRRIVQLCRSGQLESEGELHALRDFRLRRA